jgi:polyglutamine-binding protein 1
MPQELPPYLKKRLLARGIAVDGVDAKQEEGKREEDVAPTKSDERPLPAGWAVAIDKKYGHKYYYNASTGKSSWERPTESADASADAAQLPPGWKEATDPSTGRTYFCNPFTSQTTWERPVDAAAVAKMKRCKGCGGFGRGLVQPNGYCRHCGRILNKQSVGSAGETSRLPAVTTAAPLRGSSDKQSSVMISKGPGAYVDSNVSQGIGPSAIPRKVFVETRAAPASSAPVSRKRQRPAQGGIDPMDPASYSDAPVGGWGAGLDSGNKKEASGGGGLPLPSPGDILRQNARATSQAETSTKEFQKSGLGEAD